MSVIIMIKVDSTRLLIFNSKKGTFRCWPSRPLRVQRGRIYAFDACGGVAVVAYVKNYVVRWRHTAVGQTDIFFFIALSSIPIPRSKNVCDVRIHFEQL